MSDTQVPIRVVGGGMMGLTTAYRLAKLGYRVAVHERDPYLGGLSSESSLCGIPVERFYHCVLPTDTELLALFDELGIGNQVGWTRTRTGFFHSGRILEMTTAGDFLKFPVLTPFDRLRLGWTVAFCGLNRSWEKLDAIPIEPFLRRHSGDRVFEALWEPLLVAKLGPNYNRFAASFIWATVNRMFSARKAKGHAEKLGFVKGRYGKVFSALSHAIRMRGGEVLAGQAVTRLTRTDGGSAVRWLLHSEKATFPARAVILCVPAPTAAEIVRDLLPDKAEQLQKVEYLGVICDVLVLKTNLTPFYVLNLTEKSLGLTGVIETGNLTGKDEFGGHSVAYFPRYRDQSSKDWGKSDEQIHEETLANLSKIIPGFSQEIVVGSRIHRARFVQPVNPVGRGADVPGLNLGPDLAYLSTAQIHPWPVFNNEVVRLVNRSVPWITERTLGTMVGSEQDDVVLSPQARVPEL